jgi:hypothetical protein
VTWDPSTTGRAALLFMDIDCGGRPATDSTAGSKGPLVHSFYEGCTAGSLASCSVVKKWLPPGNGRPVPNRYTFVLFQQGDVATLQQSAL